MRFVIFVVFILVVHHGSAQWIQDTSVNTDSCYRTDTAYLRFKERIHQQRVRFSEAYRLTPNKRKCLDSCKKYLENCLTDTLFQFWKNTPWAFYGKTEVPNCGAVACGYFVTTLLRDLDFSIPRIAWAEMASETFIRAFCGNHVQRF